MELNNCKKMKEKNKKKVGHFILQGILKDDFIVFENEKIVEKKVTFSEKICVIYLKDTDDRYCSDVLDKMRETRISKN